MGGKQIGLADEKRDNSRTRDDSDLGPVRSESLWRDVSNGIAHVEIDRLVVEKIEIEVEIDGSQAHNLLNDGKSDA